MIDLVGGAVARIVSRDPADRTLGDRAADALAPFAEAAEALCATELAGVARAVEVAVEILVELWDTGDPTPEALAAIARRRGRLARAESRDVLAEDGVLEVMTPARLALRSRQPEERDQIVAQAVEGVLDERQYEVARQRWVEHRQRAEVARAFAIDVDEVCRLLEACRPGVRAELERLLLPRPARRPRSRAG